MRPPQDYVDDVYHAFMGTKESHDNEKKNTSGHAVLRTNTKEDKANKNEAGVCDDLLRASASGKGLAGVVARLKAGGQSDEAMKTCRDGLGRSAVLLACMKGGAEHVDRVLAAHPSLPDALADRDRHGLTPLEYSSWRGHVEVVDLLLQLGADPNSYDSFGLQALHKAVGHGQIATTLRLLSDGGVDCNARCGDVTAPKEYLAKTKHQTALHIACSREEHGQPAHADPKMVSMLLRHGCDPNLQDDFGNTPMHASAMACDLGTVRMLLRAGGKPQRPNLTGQLPIDMLPDGCTWTLYDLLESYQAIR